MRNSFISFTQLNQITQTSAWNLKIDSKQTEIVCTEKIQPKLIDWIKMKEIGEWEKEEVAATTRVNYKSQKILE